MLRILNEVLRFSQFCYNCYNEILEVFHAYIILWYKLKAPEIIIKLLKLIHSKSFIRIFFLGIFHSIKIFLSHFDIN